MADDGHVCVCACLCFCEGVEQRKPDQLCQTLCALATRAPLSEAVVEAYIQLGGIT